MKSPTDLIALLQSQNPDQISVDIETDGLSKEAEVFSVGVAFIIDGKMHSYATKTDRFASEYDSGTEPNIRSLVELLVTNRGPGKITIFHNFQFDLPILLRRIAGAGYAPKLSDLMHIHDTQVLSRTLWNNKFVSHLDANSDSCHSLKYLSRSLLERNATTFKEVIDGASIRNAETPKVLKYNCDDAENTLLLFHLLKKQSGPKEWMYYNKIEMPFNHCVFQMNLRGLPFRFDLAKNLSNFIFSRISSIKTDLFLKIGKSFNTNSQREVASAIFRNPRLLTKDGNRLSPLFITENSQIKIDIDTLLILVRRGLEPNTELAIRTLIEVFELEHSYNVLDQLRNHARKQPDGTHRIFPNISVDAKTGRVRTGAPNVLAIPKAILQETSFNENWPQSLPKSLRNLIGFEPNSKQQFYSIDISGLDLGVIASGVSRTHPNSFWLTCFRKFGANNSIALDTHMAILSKVDPEKYKPAIYPIIQQSELIADKNRLFQISKKDSNGNIHLVETEINKTFTISESKLDRQALKNLKEIREPMKTLNLAIPYNLGANQLALKLTQATGRFVGEYEAKEILEKYHQTFPEIRVFQDRLASDVYHLGYAETFFGRRIYADCFDIFNKGGSDINVDFIFKLKDTFWLIAAKSWKKDSNLHFKSLKSKSEIGPMTFERITQAILLPSDIFSVKKSMSFSKLKRKSEYRLEDQHKFEKDFFDLTFLIDSYKDSLGSFSTEWDEVKDLFVTTDGLRIPESGIQLYRIKGNNSHTKFFQVYKPIEKVVRPFFATFCQSEATIVAKICAVDIVKKIENSNLESYLGLFIHDQFDLICKSSEAEKIKDILDGAIQHPKIFNGNEYPVIFSGEFKNKGSCFS
ncbi:hypothetical protein K2X05_11555 [bacterium]|nr:hypothetical protein [bacterium]